MATIKCNGIELEEVTKPQIFDPPQEMLVIDEADDKPIRKRVAAILATGYCHNVVATDETFWQSCFRIPDPLKSRRATNRELAKWLAQGHGEMRYERKPHVYYSSTCFDYDTDNEDEPRYGIQVRKWEDAEWHEPIIDYMGIET